MPDEKSSRGATRLPANLTNLEFLAETYETADQFASMYETMLSDARRRKDLVLVRKLRKLLMRQSRYLIQEFKAAGGRYAFELHEGPEAKTEAETIQ